VIDSPTYKIHSRFAIPIDRAKEIIEELKTYGRVQRPYIGISMLSVSHNTRHKYCSLFILRFRLSLF